MRTAVRWLVVFVLMTGLGSAASAADDDDPDLVADLKLLQGSWELLHGNEGKGPPTIRSVKTIVGNIETLRRFSIETGQMLHEHSVEIALSKTGDVRVATFFRAGGNKQNGLSYIYKVDEGNFYDIPGLLHGADFRNYQEKPTIWHWKRVKEKGAAGDAAKDPAAS